MKMMPIYFDNSTTTKPYPEVVEKITEMLTDNFGDPSALHSYGLRAKEILESSRQTIADALGANAEEIYFTSGGTESNNLAILGFTGERVPRRIITSSVEHPSVYKPLRHLSHRGWTVDYISIKDGKLDMAQAQELITAGTILASVMLVNNETGTILPVNEIKQIIEKKAPASVLHCDATQGFGKIPFTVNGLGADLVSLSAHKIHGPKGVGALYIRKGTNLKRRVLGGEQEKDIRSGTEALPLIAGFAEAVRITMLDQEKNALYMNELKAYALERIAQVFPDALINSTLDGAPHIVNFSLPGISNLNAAGYLSDNGICISTSSVVKSCPSKGPSIMNFGLSAEMADSTLRVGFSGENTKEEVDTMIACLDQYRAKY